MAKIELKSWNYKMFYTIFHSVLQIQLHVKIATEAF